MTENQTTPGVEEAEERGRSDCRNGTGRGSNPYPYRFEADEALHHAWDRGWLAADAEARARAHDAAFDGHMAALEGAARRVPARFTKAGAEAWLAAYDRGISGNAG